MKNLKEFLKNKEKQGGICAFFAMLLAMCVVGSYYLQYSQDLYWVKLFTYAIMILCGGYVFASSVVRKDTFEATAMFGLLLALVFAEIESVFWLTRRADLRKAAEALSLAFKAAATFTLIDVLVIKSALIKKVWYIIVSVVTLLIPAIVKSLPLVVTSLVDGFLAENISILNIIFNAFVIIFGLAAIVLCFIKIAKKEGTFAVYASMCYALSIFLYGAFGLLRQIGYDAVQWSKNTSILFEIGAMMLIIAIVNYNKPVNKKSVSRK